MNTFKTILLILMLVTLEMPPNVWAVEDAMGHPTTSKATDLPIPPTGVDDATLLQYALQLRETKPELFAGAQGVLVLNIVPDSQAEKKGLQRGDIVVAYDGQSINTARQLVTTVQANAAKPQVELQFIRAGIVQTLVLQGGRIGISLKDIIVEMSPEQFFNEFFSAALAEDVKRLHRLLTNNPNTTIEVQQRLNFLSKGTGEETEGFQYLARLLEQLRQASNREEIPPKAFLEDFLTALQAENDEKLYQLVTNNPNTAEQVQKELTLLGEGTGEKAEQFRALAKTLTEIRKLSLHSHPALHQLGIEGQKAFDSSDYSTALKKWQTGLQQAQTLGKKSDIARFLGSIGLVYSVIEDYQKSLQHYKQAQVLHRELIDKGGESATLTNIGLVYRQLKQHKKALEYHQQALAISREINDKRGKVRDLVNIGVVHDDLGQYQQALTYYQSALAIQREIDDKEGEAKSLANIGDIYQNLKKYEQSLEYYQQSLEINRQIGNKHGEGASLTNIASVSQHLKQSQKKSEYLDQAWGTIEERLNKLDDEGKQAFNTNDVQTALTKWEEGLAILAHFNEPKNTAVFTHNIGVAYARLHQYERALEYFQRALVSGQETQEPYLESIALGSIGDVYRVLGQHEMALEQYQKALSIKRQVKKRDKNDDGEAIILGNLGALYDELGQSDRALEYYQQALTIFQETENQIAQCTLFNNIGIAYQDERALEFYQQALVISRKIGDIHCEALALGNMGQLGYALGEYEPALSFLHDSLAIGEKLGDLRLLWQVQSSLGKIHAKRKTTDLAVTYYELALKTIETLLRQLQNKDYKLSFKQRKIHVYDEFITLLQSLHQEYSKKGYDRKALEIFERKQGRIFLEEMGESGTKRFGGLPNKVRQEETYLEEHLHAAHIALNEARAQGKKAKHRSRLEIKMAELSKKQQIFIQNLQTHFPRYHALKYPKPVALETLQKDVLQADELMLIYNVGEEATGLWVVGKEHFALFTVPLTAEQMQQQVTAFREVGIESMLNKMEDAKKKRKEGVALKRHLKRAVRKTLPKFVTTSHAFYQQLLPEPVRKLLTQAKPQTLYVVPTGALYSLPFEALVTVANKKRPRYLLQDYGIAYLSSASLLKTLRDAKNRRHISKRRSLLAFADPKYPQDNCESLTKGGVIQELRTRAYQKMFWGNNNKACFPPLPNTAEEAREIADLFTVKKKYPKRLHLQQEAAIKTVTRFNKKQWLDDFRYVLFSTHAILPDEVDHIKQPALVLSDGYLKMADVFGLSMNADLVTLSACNTGRGKNIKGEGVRGLTRAFMYAGTPAVAVTLWEIHSGSSKALSVDFFRHKQQHSLAKSLQKAKLAMLKGQHEKYYRHPYFWAGLVVFGDGR